MQGQLEQSRNWKGAGRTRPLGAGRWREQAGSQISRLPVCSFLEDPEDELHLLVCLWLRARGRSTDGPELQREQEVFRDIKVSRELGTRTH